MYILASEDLCTSLTGYRIFSFIGHLLNFIQIIIPILLIVIGTIDLIKLMMKEEDNKAGFKKLIIKFILAVTIFFIPIIVRSVTSLVTKNTANACIDCLVKPNECTKKAEILSPLKCPSNESFKKDNNCTDEICQKRKDCKKIKGEWKCCIGNI